MKRIRPGWGWWVLLFVLGLGANLAHVLASLLK